MEQPNTFIHQVRSGMDVVDADGDKIGEVGDVNIGTFTGDVNAQTTSSERSYFEVRRGFLGFGDDLWIPASAIADVRDGKVVLNVTKDQVGDIAWNQEPVQPEPTAQGPGPFGLTDEE